MSGLRRWFTGHRLVATGFGTFCAAVMLVADVFGFRRRHDFVNSWDDVLVRLPIYVAFGVLMGAVSRGLLRLDAPPALACPSCARAYEGSTRPKTCGSCHIPLEPLAGFYDRHPHHRDDES